MILANKISSGLLSVMGAGILANSAQAASMVVYQETFPLIPNTISHQNALQDGWSGFYDGLLPTNQTFTKGTGQSLQVFSGGNSNVANDGYAFWSPLRGRVMLYTREFQLQNIQDLQKITYDVRHAPQPGNLRNDGFDRPTILVGGTWYVPNSYYEYTGDGNTWQTAEFDVTKYLWGALDVRLSEDPTSSISWELNNSIPGGSSPNPAPVFNQSFANLSGSLEGFGIWIEDPRERNGNHRFDNYTLVTEAPKSVPEPSTVVALGIFGIVCFIRKK